MPEQTILSSMLSRILAKMAEIYNCSPIGKYRRDFVVELFRVVLAMRGRMTFTTMDLAGRLRMTDPDTFCKKALFGGVGPSTAYGCSLLMVRRVG